jgi:hypothetical protein
VRLIVDDWVDDARMSNDSEIPNATLEDIRAAIKHLDQHRHTMVGLADERGNLIIGGGAGFFVVSGTLADDTVITLRSPEESDPGAYVSIVTGGQEGHFPTKHVVSLDRALKAAEAFLTGADLFAVLPWDVG